MSYISATDGEASWIVPLVMLFSGRALKSSMASCYLCTSYYVNFIIIYHEALTFSASFELWGAWQKTVTNHMIDRYLHMFSMIIMVSLSLINGLAAPGDFSTLHYRVGKTTCRDYVSIASELIKERDSLTPEISNWSFQLQFSGSVSEMISPLNHTFRSCNFPPSNYLSAHRKISSESLMKAELNQMNKRKYLHRAIFSAHFRLIRPFALRKNYAWGTVEGHLMSAFDLRNAPTLDWISMDQLLDPNKLLSSFTTLRSTVHLILSASSNGRLNANKINWVKNIFKNSAREEGTPRHEAHQEEAQMPKWKTIIAKASQIITEESLLFEHQTEKWNCYLRA